MINSLRGENEKGAGAPFPPGDLRREKSAVAGKKDGRTPPKTNAVRLLEQAKVPFEQHFYGETGAVSGMEVAQALGQDPRQVLKTLVTQGRSGEHYVFVIPACGELDLKKAAKAVGEKSIEMLRAKELLPLTGYVHGGCSPVGMKKRFVTVIDESAGAFDRVMVNGGAIGCQVELRLEDLARLVPFKTADVVV